MGDVPFLGSITCPGSMGLISAGWSCIQHPTSSRNDDFFCFCGRKDKCFFRDLQHFAPIFFRLWPMFLLCPPRLFGSADALNISNPSFKMPVGKVR